MKPLRLRMQAFGPYADVATVDFRGLLHGGLFLIHGPTGAGKTSILDGLCFSLFGRSSGSERAPENLRCDRAPANLSTEVQLEFALGNRIYRVIRRPRQIVKKQRGEGLTSNPAKGELFESLQSDVELDEMEWTLVASGEKKTDDRVTELLGMNEEQFRQVVVLPQGQFRKFLSSSSDDREELLETLFRTEQYRELAERLQARASAMAQEINSKRQVVQSQLSLTGCETLASLDATISEFREILQELQTSETDHDRKFSEALARRDAARVYARDIAELKTCVARSETLELKKPEIEAINSRLENERRARSVLAIDVQAVSLTSNLQELAAQKNSELRALIGQQAMLEEKLKTKSDLTSRKAEIEAFQIERSQLQLIYTEAKNLNQANLELHQRQTSLWTADKKFDAENIALKNSKETRAILLAEIEKFAGVTHELARSRISFEKLSASTLWLERELKTIDETGRRAVRARELFDTASVQYQKATVTANELKLKFHLSQASQLAHLLKVNEECPVCGSLDHPKPANHAQTANSPSPDEIEKADRDLRRLGEEVSATRARYEAILEEAKKGVESLSTNLGVTDNVLDKAAQEFADLKQKSLSLSGEIKRLELDERTLTEAKQKQDSLSRQILQSEQSHEALRQTRDELQRAFEKVRQQIAGFENRVPEKYRDLEAITKRGQALRQEIDLYTKANEQIEREVVDASEKVVRTTANIKTFSSQAESKSEQLKTLNLQLENAMQAEGFTSIDEARAAALTGDRARQLEQTKKVFENDWAANQTRLQTLRTQLTDVPEWASDLDQVEAIYSQLDGERRARVNQVAELRAKAESLESVSRKTKSIEVEMAESEEKYKVLGKLAAVANGQPPHNLTRCEFSTLRSRGTPRRSSQSSFETAVFNEPRTVYSSSLKKCRRQT